MSDTVQARLAGWIEGLAAISRPSTSDGERSAADWIVAELAKMGINGRVEAEAAHGTHWLPLGLPNVLAAVAALVGRRAIRGFLGLAAFAAIADDLEGGPRLLRRRLGRRDAYNAVAELGAPGATRTVLFVAHHDVARAFHPLFSRVASAPPELPRGRGLPIVASLAYGPLVVAASTVFGRSARGLGGAYSALAALVEFDIARRDPVPGANDNATGVAVLLELARQLSSPGALPADVRVVLLSTGAEETLLEGMEGFWRRHGAALDPTSTLVVCVDTVGWSRLLLRAGEGVLRVRRSAPELLAHVQGVADAQAVQLDQAPAFPVPTDGLVARRAGVPTVLLTSADDDGGSPHYHQPTDVSQHVDLGSVAGCAEVCAGLVAAASRGAGRAS